MAWQIIRSTAAGTPSLRRSARGLGDHHPPHGLRPVGARLELRADLRPVVIQPRPQLLGAHPVDARGTGVLLDASERLGEIPAGQQLLPQRTRVGGVSGGVVRRRIVAALWPVILGLHPPNPPGQAPDGVGCGQRNDHEHERPDARLRVRPFPAITIPAGTTASADFSTASRGLSSHRRPAPPREPVGRGIWDTRGDLPR